MSRYADGHVPDLCRPVDGLQRCLCGFVAVTLDAVRAHARNPQPEPVWEPPLVPPALPLPERRLCAAMAGGYDVFPVHRCGRLTMHDSDYCWQHTTTHRRMAA